jgi:hypothetical protein
MMRSASTSASRLRRVGYVFAAVLLFASGLRASPFSLSLLQSETPWGDGQAELAIFRGTEKRYGIARETELRHILVREHFAAEGLVKADDWRAPGAYAVFKLNQLIQVPTGTYRYDQGHSAFWRVADGALLKFTHTTNDSCGLSYKRGELLGAGPQWRYRALTYWEGMSDVDTQAPAPAGALFYDELPFRLRLLDWERVDTFRAPLMASVIGSRAEAFAWPEAEFTVVREGETWRVQVRHARGEDRFWFDAAAPHGLRVWERWDDTRIERTQLLRLPYWELNRPGDERRLEAR